MQKIQTIQRRYSFGKGRRAVPRCEAGRQGEGKKLIKNGRRKRALLCLCLGLLLLLGLQGTASAGTKYYSERQLKAEGESRLGLKALEGKTLTYGTKVTKTDDIGDYNVLEPPFLKAKLSKSCKFYAANVHRASQLIREDSSNLKKYQKGTLKYLCRVTKKQFFNKTFDQTLGKNPYTDLESKIHLTLKKGKVIRIVQCGHIAG